jgi:hypothetical protein
MLRTVQQRFSRQRFNTGFVGVPLAALSSWYVATSARIYFG